MGFSGLSPDQAEILGGASAAGADTWEGVSLSVHVWHVSESQRPRLVSSSDHVPLRWESRPDGLVIEGREFLASVRVRSDGEGEADLWSDWEAQEEFGIAISNFARIVLASGLSRPGPLVLHSSACVGRDGRAYLFFGPSGAGKSTLGSLALRAGHPVLSDDLNLVEVQDPGTVWTQAFPWSGTYGPRRWTGIERYPLGGLFKLEKADRHEVLPLRPAQAVAGLATCSPFVNAAPGRYARLLELLGELVGRVPAFTLRFRQDPGFLDSVYEALR